MIIKVKDGDEIQVMYSEPIKTIFQNAVECWKIAENYIVEDGKIIYNGSRYSVNKPKGVN